MKTKKDEEDSLAVQNFEDGISAASIQNFIDSGAIAVSNVESAVTIATMGKELGIQPLTALNNIHIIKGRTVIASTLLGSLLKTSGYEYVWSKNWIQETINETKHIVTEITLYWKSHLEHPETKSYTWSHVFAITWAEMQAAGYTAKENWDKYPKNMMRARCMAYAVRAIAPHILMGMYTDLEIVDNLDEKGEYTVTVNEEGEPSVDFDNFEVIAEEKDLKKNN
jgi:hypothetical protein